MTSWRISFSFSAAAAKSMGWTWAASSATCSAVTGRPSLCSARARATHSCRHVSMRFSAENWRSMNCEAYRDARGLSYCSVMGLTGG